MSRIARLTLFVLPIALLASCSSTDDPTDPGGGNDDTTPPTVVSTTPSNGVMGVPLEQIVTFVFSEAMDHASSDGNVTSNEGWAQPYWTDDRTLVFDAGTWPGDTDITVTAETGLTDEAGNALAAPFTLSFRTVDPVPVLLESTPADGAADVIRNAPLRLHFSRPMDLFSLDDALTVSSPDPTKTEHSFTLADGGDDWVVVTFDDVLPASTAMTVEITTAAMSIDGYLLDAAATFGFTTGTETDTTAPTLLSIEPAGGSVIPANTSSIVFTFDEAIDQDFGPTMISAQFEALMQQHGLTPTWSPDGTVLTVPLPGDMPAGLPIVASFDGYADVSGNVNPEIVDYRVDVAGDPSYWPLVDDSRFTFSIDEIWTPDGGSPTPNEFTDYYRVEEQNDGTFHWALYGDPFYTEHWGYDHYRLTPTALEQIGFHFDEDGEVETGTFSPAIEWARLPMAAGTWNGTSTLATPDGNVTLAYTITLVGREDVEAELESDIDTVWIDCWKATWSYTGTAGGETVFSGSGNSWYAASVGLVKRDSFETEDTGETYEFDENVTYMMY